MLDEWLAGFAFSRSVRHVARDFSDAVLMAELLAQLLPAGAVALHNYPWTGRYQQKLINWDILNRKVLTPLGCELSRQQMEELTRASPSAITVLLVRVKQQTDRKPSSRSMGKPPRSPTTKMPTTAMDCGESLSPSMRAARPVSKLPFPPVTSCAMYKTANSRRPTALSTTALLRSAPRSAPSSPRKSSLLETPASPTRSQYSLLDFLPLSSERPTTKSLPSMFTRVLQVTDYRVKFPSRGQPADFSSPRAVRAHPRSSSVKMDSNENLSAQPESNAQSKPEPIRLCIPGSTGSTTQRHDMDDHGAEVCDADAFEGSFALLECQHGSAREGARPPQLTRIVRSLPTGGCLVQLFKPSSSDKFATPSDCRKATSDAFVSTPHFIECWRSQLHTVSGIRFDPVARVWTTEQSGARPRPWSTSSNSPKVSSPLSSYTTTILSRHKFTVADVDSPLKLRTVESAESPSRSTPGSPAESSNINIAAQDLCLQPTVFTPIPVDVSAILDTLPCRFPPSTKKMRR